MRAIIMRRSLLRFTTALLAAFFALNLTTSATLGCSIGETLNPQTASAFELGLAATENHDYSGAIAHFSHAITQNQNLAAAYSNRCLTYLQIQHFQAAIADCTSAIKQSPRATEAYLNRALAHHKLGHYDAAIADSSTVIQQSPADFRAYFNRGLSHIALSQPQQAISDYTNALEHSEQATFQEISAIYTEKGLTLADLQDTDGAITDLSEAIRWNQRNHEAYYNRGYIYNQQQNFSAAIQDFDQTLAIQPNNPDAYFNRGIAAYHLGQLAHAQEDLNQAAQAFREQGQTSAYQATIDLLAKLQSRQRTAIG